MSATPTVPAPAYLLKGALSRSLDLLFAPVVCLIVAAKSYEVFDPSVFVIAVALVYTARNLLEDRRAFLRARLNWLDLAALLVTLAEVVSYAASGYKANSLYYLAEALLLFFFYYVVRFNLKHDHQRAAIYIGLSLLGLWVSARGLYSFWRHYDRTAGLGFSDLTDFKHLFWMVGPGSYTTGERITMLLLLLPFPLILFIKFRRRRLARLLLLCPVVTILLAMSVTFSRAVYAGGLAFFVAGSVLFYRHKIAPAKKILRFNLLLALAVSACLIPVAGAVLTTLSMVKTRSQVRSVEGRVHLWGASVDLVRLHPLTGIGANNFPLQYAGYTEDYTAFAASPFNYFLQVLVERGFLGLIAYCLLIIIFFRTSAKAAGAVTGELQKAAILLFMAAAAAVLVRDLAYCSILVNKGANMLLWFMLAANAGHAERDGL